MDESARERGDYFGAGYEKSSLRGIAVGFLVFSRCRSFFFRGARVRVFRTFVPGRLSVGRGEGLGDAVYEDPHPWR